MHCSSFYEPPPATTSPHRSALVGWTGSHGVTPSPPPRKGAASTECPPHDPPTGMSTSSSLREPEACVGYHHGSGQEAGPGGGEKRDLLRRVRGDPGRGAGWGAPGARGPLHQ